MDKNEIIIQAKNVTKLYGMNKSEVPKLMRTGATKEKIYKKTGVTVALWDVSFEVKRG